MDRIPPSDSLHDAALETADHPTGAAPSYRPESVRTAVRAAGPASSGPAPKSPAFGLLLALAGFGTLTCADALVKTLAGEWPGTAIAALRYLYATPLLGLLMLRRYGWRRLGVRRYDLQFGRGLATAIWSVCFFLAVQMMPLATATSILFTSPLWVALLAPRLLNERAGRTAMAATMLGLVGVLIVLRPNLMALGPTALLPLLAALGMGGLVVFNRKASGTGCVVGLQFWIAVMATPILLSSAILGHLSGVPALHVPVPSARVLATCFAIAVAATLGHWLIYVATDRASASLVAPMAYVQLLVAACLGWFLFGQGIDAVSGLGMAVIVAAGLLLWNSQRAPASAAR